MIEFAETIDYHSKVRPGATFRIKRINLLARMTLNAKIAEQIAEHDEAAEEIVALEAEPTTKEIRAEIRKLKRRKNELLIGTIIPHTIREGCTAVLGVTDGKNRPITDIEEILRLADNELFGELYGACREASQMSQEDLGNSERPGTLSAPATPAAKNTTADTASEKDSTRPETAPGISLVA